MFFDSASKRVMACATTEIEKSSENCDFGAVQFVNWLVCANRVLGGATSSARKMITQPMIRWALLLRRPYGFKHFQNCLDTEPWTLSAMHLSTTYKQTTYKQRRRHRNKHSTKSKANFFFASQESQENKNAEPTGAATVNKI